MKSHKSTKKSRNFSLFVFWLLIFNLVLAPVVQASVGGTLSRGQSYALTLLGLVTFSLFIYLFMVIFQPEKF
jgi:K+-transporting ATPase KdpF subunit